MNFINQQDLTIDVMITDRHPQIQKYIREELPTVKRYNDVWHVAKGRH